LELLAVAIRVTGLVIGLRRGNALFHCYFAGAVEVAA